MNVSVLFTRKSSNVKTGDIAVSMTGKDSCPAICEFRGNGCYAEHGPLAYIWSGMSAVAPHGEFKNGRHTMRTMGWSDLCGEVSNLPEGQLWRHNQAGDLPHTGGKIDAAMVADLVSANEGKRGFTYTHHNALQSADNRKTVKSANASGFTINLSGNTLRHADQLADLEIAPVVTVLPIDLERGNVKGEWTEDMADYRARTRDISTPKGRKVVVCPATYRDDVTCKSCGLCAVAKRKVIVGFPAHGAAKKKASGVAVNA
jgi:hypothetical protein